MSSVDSGRVTSPDGTSIAFERSGRGPALILIDPAGGFREVGPMRPLAQELSSRFTVFAYDRRGRGESTDTPPYAVEREIEDLHSLIVAAGGSAYVYGFSSGAILALLAAAHGLAIPKVALLEPPLGVGAGRPPNTDLSGQVARLVVLGRREEALELWMTRIGVPAEIVASMRTDPSWSARAAVAHTLVYESLIPGSLPREELAGMTTPSLVVASDASGEQLQSWSRELAEALPNGAFRLLHGQWHGIAPHDLAPVLTEFFGA